MNVTRLFFRTGVSLTLALAATWVLAAPLPAQTDPTTHLFGIWWDPAPRTPCEGDEVALVFTACTCNTQIVSVEPPVPGPIRVRAVIHDVVCVQCAPASVSVPLGRLAAGTHSFVVEFQVTFVASDSTVREETGTAVAQFEVLRDCPPPGELPFVSQVRIGGPPPCPDCPPQACEGDSIPVFAFGEMPDHCYEFKGVELAANPTASPLPAPPIARLHFAINSCIDMACIQVPKPWSAVFRIPPLPSLSGSVYRLPVEVWLGDECYPGSLEEVLGRKTFPFTVAPCSTERCFEPGWKTPSGEPYASCHARVSDADPARIVMTVDSRVPLAGLEGDLVLDPPALRITGIRPVGPAQGMLLDWRQTPEGARFVLFAQSGAPIPGDGPGSPHPILEIEASAIPGVPIPPMTRLVALRLLGSDVDGGGVTPCPSILLDMRLIDSAARICRAARCDLNADGAADVRDLVLLVHCVQGEGPCPPPGDQMSADCDGDGGLDLDDVFCCARVVLRDSAPDTAAGRPEPSVRVTLGAPAHEANGEVLVPLTLSGSDRVGAARLELAFPSARYEVAAVDFPGLGAAWMPLHEPASGRVTIGLIGLSSGEQPPGSEIPVQVRLRLKPGQTHGGETALTATQFAGRDGVALEVDTGQPALPLGGFTGIALSPASPNPFHDEVRVAVLLAAPADIEVAVYDATGRKVAVLHRGPAAAGAFEARWQGRREDGTLAANGVYLLRAAGAGSVATRKVHFLGR